MIITNKAVKRHEKYRQMHDSISFLSKDELMKLDKAFGEIHETLPEYYKLSALAMTQCVISRRLSEL